jgi:lauroyl/myristoyl acyltransferase
MAAGKGAILVTAHFGNLDVVSQVFALRNFAVTAAAEHLRPEKLFQYVVSLRASKGIQLVPADQFLRPLFHTLRQNGIVALAADRNLTGSGTLTRFFGSPALLPDGHVRLARRAW